MGPRQCLAYLTFPLLLLGFLGIGAWGLARGYPAASWGMGLTVAHFVVILACERLLPRNPGMGVFRDGQSWNDIGHGLLLAAFARPLGGALSVGLLAAMATFRDALGGAGPWPVAWPFPAQVAVALLVWSFCDYWLHRSYHSFDRLWWFHAVHHDTPQMHILKSGRLHFGEELIDSLLKPLPLLLLGATPEIMVFLGMWIVFDGNLVHANVDQRFPSWVHYLVGTVQLHNLHHAQERRYQDGNYSGSTPIWDIAFGTFNHPDRSELGPLGIEASPVPQGFFDQLLFPFRAQLAPPLPAASARAPLAQPPARG